MIPFVYNPQIRNYSFGQLHPFHRERYDDFMEVMISQGYQKNFSFITPRTATRDDLLTIHTAGYIDRVDTLEKINGRLTMDTPLVPGMTEAGKIVVGHGLQAMDLVMNGEEIAVTFGGTHHAGRDYGGGFCLYNDVAIIAQRLIDDFGVKRVLIIDTDAHHGNGTQDIFYETSKVLYMSVHQDPRTLYPGTGFINEIGEKDGKGFTVNVPVLPFSGDAVFEMVLQEIMLPLAELFDPQVVIRNGGSDVHYLDELTHLGMSCAGLYRMGEIAREIASGCKRHIDLTLSGYNKMILPYAWLSLICGVTSLLPPQIPDMEQAKYKKEDASLLSATWDTIKKVKRKLEPYWTL